MDREIAWARTDIAGAQSNMTIGLIGFSLAVVALLIAAAATGSIALYTTAAGFCMSLGGFMGWQDRLITRAGEYIRVTQKAGPDSYVTWEAYLADLRTRQTVALYVALTMAGPIFALISSIVPLIVLGYSN